MSNPIELRLPAVISWLKGVKKSAAEKSDRNQATEAMKLLTDMEAEIVRLRQERAVSLADVNRLTHWFSGEKRKPAVLAFTEGPERQVAYMIEDATNRTNRIPADRRKEDLLAKAKAFADSKSRPVCFEAISRAISESGVNVATDFLEILIEERPVFVMEQNEIPEALPFALVVLSESIDDRFAGFWVGCYSDVKEAIEGARSLGLPVTVH